MPLSMEVPVANSHDWSWTHRWRPVATFLFLLNRATCFVVTGTALVGLGGDDRCLRV